MDTIWAELKNYHVALSPAQFEELKKLIYENSGIYFSEQKLYLLESRLNKRLKELGLKSFDEYLKYLKRQFDLTQELKNIYDYITINETYFFRYEKQLFYCIQECLPKLVQRGSNSNTIRIWSAGCSSGEEPYSIAILIEEHNNSKWWRPNIEILGTDISMRMLNKAKEGVYSVNSFRNNFSNYYLAKYFLPKDNQYVLKDALRSKVRFDYLNLNDTLRVEQLKPIDVIFCRNVLIYFDDIVKKKVIRSFYNILSHGGYLFLGEAESLHGISTAFEVIHFEGGFCYRKE